MFEPDTCGWCGEEITNKEGARYVIEGTPDRNSVPDAAFHTGVCYSEAASYGWK